MTSTTINKVAAILTVILSILTFVTPFATTKIRRSLRHGFTSLNQHREEQRQGQGHETTKLLTDMDTAAILSSHTTKTRISLTRKSFLQSLPLAIIASQGQAAWASTTTNDIVDRGGVLPAGPIDKNMENGMLESRVLENLLSPPTYGMEASDISFPSYFTGVWNSNSTTKSIQAPCGIPLFGGNATYTRAIAEVNTSITYRSRFLPSSTSNDDVPRSIAIADREFNVAEITKASIGTKAVMDIPVATPNKLSAVLSPNGADGMIFRADLLTLARREESVGNREFHCSEVVRQIVSPMGNGTGGRMKSSLVKEIETTSLYTALSGGGDGGGEGDVKEIRCLQRTATFLVPSQEDPMALRMWEASRGRPIDIRFYDVVYTKL